MGKKNKKNTTASNEHEEIPVTNEIKTKGIIKSKQPKIKNKIQSLSTNNTETKVSKIENLQNSEIKTKKRKSEESNNCDSPDSKKINSKTNLNVTKDKSNKKIIVDGNNETPKEGKKTKTFLNDDEAAVRDEDIDKFCDELTEEDNKTYENWIEMFESNFKKSKKT